MDEIKQRYMNALMPISPYADAMAMPRVGGVYNALGADPYSQFGRDPEPAQSVERSNGPIAHSAFMQLGMSPEMISKILNNPFTGLAFQTANGFDQMSQGNVARGATNVGINAALAVGGGALARGLAKNLDGRLDRALYGENQTGLQNIMSLYSKGPPNLMRSFPSGRSPGIRSMYRVDSQDLRPMTPAERRNMLYTVE